MASTSAESVYDTYPPLHAVANSVNTFGAKLLVEYRDRTSSQDSVVFSPLNLVTTFRLLFLGANGTTRSQLDSVLDFTNPSVEQKLANKSKNLIERNVARMAFRLYIDNSIDLKEMYLDSVGRKRVLNVDFGNNSHAVTNSINNWVSRRTNSLIPKLLSEDDITAATIMVLVNALYFKGLWEYPFDANLTKPDIFHGVYGNQTVPFMILEDKYLIHKEVPDLDGVIFEVPYQQDQFGLYVFLPNTKDGWRDAEKKFPKFAGKIFDTDFSRQKFGTLKLPKWELEFTFEGLEDGLQHLEITDIFTPQADLSGMTNSSALVVSKLIHKAKIIVNEEGTEAAAVTAAIVSRSAAISFPISITVDHPFLYFIVDRSDKTVLFQGTQTSFP
eukprot:g2231.t1